MGGGPIFIGGLSFSGKTLLRLMLSSHPNIAMTRRSYMWRRFYGQYGHLSRVENFERCLAAMLQHKHIQVLAPDPDRIRCEFRRGSPTYARLFALFHEHYAEGLGKSRWGDQLGLVERYAGPIFTAYPDAKMIHMVRDPRDRYEASTPASRHRSGRVGWDVARWLHSVHLAMRNQLAYPDRYRVVCYEALLSWPEETLRGICAFLDEKFVPALLTMEDAIRFGDEERHIFPSDLPGTRPIEAGRTRRLMSAGEVAFIQAQTRRELLAHGYRLESVRFSPIQRIRFYSVEWPANVAGMLAWHTVETTAFARH